MLVEICTNSYQSAVIAQKAGAHRIELCAELAVGGVTPSYGLIKKVVETLSIPVFVLIRPRSGDFTYSNEEFRIMKENITLCKELGCAGIVSGVLHVDNTIDLERTKKLVEHSKPMQFTFHRAFDWVKNPLESAKQLEKAGVHRVLTSGQETSAEKGLSLLKELQSSTSLTILPGGGINIQNATLFRESGFAEIHLSASKQVQTITTPKISMNSPKLLSDTSLTHSDAENIEKILNIVTNA
ncbi:copper homeostasis protein CutC [Flavobacteriaceae bacterium S356]|uniref:PF03932 family protein CutC n=1 Tax=Asprobacillus argus TaxID=3076534 RepID=A0ABU3LH37_9FLAO|nr:copper homeostasis protein CutC [Flavobacteriaceae bacterium S356]